MIDLSVLYPDLDEIIELKLKELIRAWKLGELGELCEELCVAYRTAGIAALLLDLDTDRMHHMFIRSGLTRAYMLEHTSPEDRDGSRFCKVTRANGFFDSIAANQLDIGRRIIALGPQQRHDQFEYEEDYCYVRFLYELLQGGEQEEQNGLLDRWKALLEKTTAARYDVCRALQGRDGEGFHDAFSRLSSDRAVEIEAQKRSLSRDEIEFAGARHVNVEGLALLRFAAMVGITTRDEYEYCPREARAAMSAPFPNNNYPGS